MFAVFQNLISTLSKSLDYTVLMEHYTFMAIQKNPKTELININC